MSTDAGEKDPAARILEDWIEERGSLDATPGAPPATEPVLGLMRAARRAAPQLSEAEAAEVFASVRRRGRSLARRPLLAFLAAAAAVLAVVSAWPVHRPAPSRTIVKQMSLEVEHQGKVMRLEMTLYRVEEKRREPNAGKSSL